MGGKGIRWLISTMVMSFILIVVVTIISLMYLVRSIVSRPLMTKEKIENSLNNFMERLKNTFTN